MEGKDIYSGKADVIVSDGFTGNVALKVSEGVVESLFSMVRNEVMKNFFAKIGLLLMKRNLKKVYKKVDYSEYGGAHLLGLNGVCIIGHGRSNVRAVKNAVRMSREFVMNQIQDRIQTEMVRFEHAAPGGQRMMLFEGRVSIVTGASQGIGETIAADLAREGAQVVLVDIQKDKLEAVAGRIRESGGKAVCHEANVTRLEDATRVVESVLRDFGRIDHLVNNAGITRDNLLLRMKEEEWDAVIGVNLKGCWNFSKAVIKSMVAGRYGRIVNIASVVGLAGNPGQANYAASKAGVMGFSRALAREVASRGITVNCVAPGYIATAMTDKLPEEVKKAFMDSIPVKRFGLPKEVAFAVKFLLSEEAAYITGQVINVNGGMYM